MSGFRLTKSQRLLIIILITFIFFVTEIAGKVKLGDELVQEFC